MSGNFNYRGEIARERVEASERCRGGAIGARLNLRTTLVRNFDSRYIGGGGGQMASMSLFHASRLIERLEWQAFLPLLVYLAMRQSSSEKHSRDSFFFRTQKPKGKVSLHPVCALSRVCGSRVEYIDNRASCAGTGYLCRHVFSIPPIACLLFEAKSN